MKWFNTLSHNRWLEQETDRILDFGKTPPYRPALAGWAITGRCVAIWAHICGSPPACCMCTRWRRTWGARRVRHVEHGINALNGPLRDKQHGGWYACVNDEGVIDASKQGYQHFFVLLGAASAVTTGHPQARKLLDDAIEVIERYFWSEQEQMC